MRYGSIEFMYAEPFANLLATDARFCAWVLHKTKFAAFADGARVLHGEMRQRRSQQSATWWRSHFTEKCRCQGCSGQETDILAIFEAKTGTRFGLHIEVKQPADKFPTNKDQASNYAFRAACWVKSPPASVLRHSDAATVLLYSAAKCNEYATQLAKFGTALTFEEVAAEFPQCYGDNEALAICTLKAASPVT
jgi:hypothetical protein